MLQMSLQHCCWASCQIAIKTKFPGIIDIIGMMPCWFYLKCFTHAALCILKGDASLRKKHRCLGMFLHKCDLHCSGRNWYKRGILWKAIIHSLSSTCFSFISFWIDELIHFYSIYMSSMNIEFHLWYENCRRHFQMYLQRKCLNFDYNFTEVCSQGSN